MARRRAALALLICARGSTPFLIPSGLHLARSRGVILNAASLTGSDRASAGPAILDWCFKNGVDKRGTKVTVGPSTAKGLGLLASSSIKAREAVAVVPLTLCLSAESAKASPIGKALGSFEPEAGEASLIALQLLYETSQGPKSKYAAFLAGLPLEGEEGFDHPLFWSTEELAVLAKSSTRNLAQLAEAVEADWGYVQANVLGKVAGMDAFDLKAFKWAVAVALSRSFFAEGALRLAPLLDFANKGEAGKGLEPDVVGLGIFGGKGLRLVADRDYAQGQEVVVSYGPKSGAEHLEDHGFVPVTKPEDSLCELSFEITEEDRFFDDKEDIIQSEKLQLRQSFDLTSLGDVEESMIQFLRLAMLKEKDAFLLEAVFRRDVWRFMELPVSEPNERDVLEAISKACSEALAAFDEAEALATDLQGKAGIRPERLELAKRLRDGERVALEATKGWAERDMMTLEDREYYQERRLNELGLCGPLDDAELLDSAALSRQGRSARDIDW